MPRYFAYGSNMSLDAMRQRCPGSKFICVGCLEGYRLDFTRDSAGWKGGVADIVSKEGSEVWGLVYEITDRDLEALDQYEGYRYAYDRRKIDVKTEAGVMRDLWVYSVRHKESFVAPASDYLGLIKKAAAEFDFPLSYRESLESFPVRRS